MMRKLLLLFSFVFVCSIARGAEGDARRPNILLIFSDDHAWQSISAYGDERRLLETPQIDRLAESGMRFDRCLVPNAICGPSRATVLTGKYSHMHGFYNNETVPFDGSQQTFPKLLRKEGYQTAIIGKWHLESEPTGFDHWEILPGQGEYYNPHFVRDGEKVAHEGYVTDIITELSLEWISQRNKEQPFMLMMQHKAPHRPWQPALRHLGWDHDRKHPEPDTLFDDYDGDRGLAWSDQDMTIRDSFVDTDTKLKTPAGMNAEQLEAWNAYYEPRNAQFRKDNPQGKDLVRWKYQRYMHDYLGTVLAVDESVGRVMDYLEENGLAENTVVIYASDQGFFLGEHGWFDKRWILEESMRTPLIVRWPGVTKAGSSSDEIVSVLDLAQTFLEMAHAPEPKDMQGHSLAPLLKGETPGDWRDSFYYHYYEYPVWHHVRPHYGVVTDRYKLVHYYMPDLDQWELYDLKVNPDETRNFINDPEYADTVANLRKELHRLRKELKLPELGSAPRHAYGKYPFDAGGQPSWHKK